MDICCVNIFLLWKQTKTSCILVVTLMSVFERKLFDICDHDWENGSRWGKIRFCVFGIFSVVLYQ